MEKKILVVDNDNFVLEWMHDLLTEAGHNVITASDGLSALDILKDYVPDVVFVDLIMPNIGGDKVCQVIRKSPHLKNVFVAVVSATLGEDPSHADLDADAYIPKGPIIEMSDAILAAVDQAGQGITFSPDGKALSDQSQVRRGITEELLANQKHLKLILNNISEAILELSADGKIIFANRTAYSLFGSSEEELLGLSFPELFEGSDRNKIQALVAEIGSGGPEIIDPFSVQFNGEPLSLKLLPVEDNMAWYIIAIVSPFN